MDDWTPKTRRPAPAPAPELERPALSRTDGEHRHDYSAEVAAIMARVGGDKPPPYRAGSLWAGRCEHLVRSVMTKAVAGFLLLVAKKHDWQTRKERKLKEPGCRNGVIGQVGIDAFDVMFQEMDPAKGFVEIAYGYIAKLAGHSRSATVDGIDALVDIGFLRRVRRKDESGQAVNAYGAFLAHDCYGLALRLLGEAPFPEDESDLARAFDRMCEEHPRARVEWAMFLRKMRALWAAEGKPVSRGSGPLKDVLDESDELDDLPKPKPQQPPETKSTEEMSLIDKLLAKMGGPSPSRTSTLDLRIPWREPLSKLGSESGSRSG